MASSISSLSSSSVYTPSNALPFRKISHPFCPPQLDFSPSFCSLQRRGPSLCLAPARPLPDHRISTRAVAEEETVAVQGEGQAAEEPAVAVPVSPSDILTMLFQAEGTMDELAIPTVTKALEGIEGISDVRVQVADGIASVELTKETTVQATGVASNLVEIIQGSGFKLNTLNLSFQDEEDM